MTEATVASIVAQIEAEDASVKSVAIRSKRGKAFRADETLHNILKDDFEILVNDRVLPVTAPVFAGASAPKTKRETHTRPSGGI